MPGYTPLAQPEEHHPSKMGVTDSSSVGRTKQSNLLLIKGNTMIEIIGWCAIAFIILKLVFNIFKSKGSKDRSWYEDPIFKKDEL